MFKRRVASEETYVADAPNPRYQGFGAQNAGFERFSRINQAKNNNRLNSKMMFLQFFIEKRG